MKGANAQMLVEHATSYTAIVFTMCENQDLFLGGNQQTELKVG